MRVLHPSAGPHQTFASMLHCFHYLPSLFLGYSRGNFTLLPSIKRNLPSDLGYFWLYVDASGCEGSNSVGIMSSWALVMPLYWSTSGVYSDGL
jgi:hypothetical protein